MSGPVVHLADIAEDYTSCGLLRREVTWVSVTTRTTCLFCLLADGEVTA